MCLEVLVLEQGLWAEQSFVCHAVSSYCCKHPAVFFSEGFPVGSLHQAASVQPSPEVTAVYHSLLCHVGGCYFLSGLPSWSPLTIFHTYLTMGRPNQ